MRQPLVVGNWKMHGSRASVGSLLADISAHASVEVAVCPSFVHLAQAQTLCAEKGVGLGGQDCSTAESGAYTGEVAAQMLADIGCDRVILGHSERRQYHAETDALIAAKLAAVAAAGLSPILCVGETQAQRESGEAEEVVREQLRAALTEQERLNKLVVAYEPVWAIGTGLTASPDQAQEMHAFIRKLLAGIDGVDANAVRVLYGGSVKPGNAAELFACADIDGALVGGASLVAADFMAIVQAATAGS